MIPDVCAINEGLEIGIDDRRLPLCEWRGPIQGVPFLHKGAHRTPGAFKLSSEFKKNKKQIFIKGPTPSSFTSIKPNTLGGQRRS